MIIGIILAILVFVLGVGAGWLTVCGLVKLITLCFGLTFSWPVATGIWLCFLLLSIVFKK